MIIQQSYNSRQEKLLFNTKRAITRLRQCQEWGEKIQITNNKHFKHDINLLLVIFNIRCTETPRCACSPWLVLACMCVRMYSMLSSWVMTTAVFWSKSFWLEITGDWRDLIHPLLRVDITPSHNTHMLARTHKHAHTHNSWRYEESEEERTRGEGKTEPTSF